MKNLDHKNIVKLIEHTDFSQSIQVVLEYVGYLNLFDYLECKECPRRDLKNIFRAICEALKYLHSHSICHLDLKLENVVLTDSIEPGQLNTSQLKLIDFGFAVKIRPAQLLTQQVGTPAYMAPELVQKRQYDGFKTDIWALGILLYRIIHRDLPFKAHDCNELFTKISRDEVKLPKNHIDRDMKAVNDLILQLLRKDPAARPTIFEVISIDLGS